MSGKPVTRLTTTNESSDESPRAKSRIPLRTTTNAPHARETVEKTLTKVRDARTSGGNGYISPAKTPANGRRTTTDPMNARPQTTFASRAGAR